MSRVEPSRADSRLRCERDRPYSHPNSVTWLFVALRDFDPMKLYFSPYSSNSRKVRLAAALLDVPLNLVEIDLARREQTEPEFLRINPMGRIPVLDDDGFVLVESSAIMIYLSDLSESSLYPKDVKSRAIANRWLFWSASHWEPTIGALVRENVVKAILGLGPPDADQVQRQEEVLRGLASVLDQHLSSREWICGPTITLPDLAVAAAAGNAVRAGFSMLPFRAIEGWFARIRALDAWKSTLSAPAAVSDSQ